ncbi:hypothetical protein ACJ72_00842 [Emergomyces africanus]|uniref:Uncharacterized protein n=1 Tax=Emergomyces africanus TaxID=1955775 RepID=A0A1B7P722_9EURO|nr:hypothetical protein ACJ72_00842 [Emergomyces africanus]
MSTPKRHIAITSSSLRSFSKKRAHPSASANSNDLGDPPPSTQSETSSPRTTTPETANSTSTQDDQETNLGSNSMKTPQAGQEKYKLGTPGLSARILQQLKTPMPPPSRSSNSGSSWILQTPSNPRQLQEQGNKTRNLVGQVQQPAGL